MTTPNQLIEVLDIALAGYSKHNEKFVISIYIKEIEVLQIINKNMAEESRSEEGEFGLSLSICFDPDDDAEILNRFTHSHFKFDSVASKHNDEQLVYFFHPLADNSEKAAKTVMKLLQKVFLIKTSQHLRFEIFEVD
jgi:hypothetical protein